MRARATGRDGSPGIRRDRSNEIESGRAGRSDKPEAASLRRAGGDLDLHFHSRGRSAAARCSQLLSRAFEDLSARHRLAHLRPAFDAARS